MKLNKLITLAVIVAITQGCAKKTEESADTSSVNEVEAVVESGVSVLSGSLDEQANNSFAFMSVKTNSIWNTLLIDKAFAASCSRAFAKTCVDGLKEIDYSNCTLPSGVRTMSGKVSLAFSDSGCSMVSTGNYVVRTYNTEISGPRGGVVYNSSDSKEDYRKGTSNTYGGGAKITKSASGHNLEILGKHKSFIKRGRELFNVSVRTLSPLVVTGGLARADRKVSNGQLEINHNIAQFTSVVTATDIKWGDCSCYPVSGSLSIAFSGKKTGSSTVTFSSECGVASLEENGQTSKIELSYCE